MYAICTLQSPIMGCSHGAIATMILLQQIGCSGFNVGVHMVQLQQENYNK